MPESVQSIADLRERLREPRREGKRIGFVPTMGALHAGHEELLRVGRAQCDVLVASIFVNPLQFDRKDDLEKYPRTWDADIEICGRQGVDLVFAPTVADLYPQEVLTFVDSPVLSTHLCGAHRPGHFRGVATVVMKLFNAVQPDVAFFGEKDAQQLTLIQRMVRDLNVPVEIVPVPTVRESDGLAMSSRNRHLTEEQRRVAPALYRGLLEGARAMTAGERQAAAVIEKATAEIATEPSVRIEYLELVDPETITPVEVVGDDALLAIAAWVGDTRLIDNIRWKRS
jgi:pantoate--beta-alanine ligase